MKTRIFFGAHGTNNSFRVAAQGLLLLLMMMMASATWAADQLLTNPGFDVNINSWNKNGGGAMSSFDTGRTGKCLRHSGRTASNNGPYQSVLADLNTYGKGLYRASAWVYLSTATDTGRVELGTKVGGTWTWTTITADVSPDNWTFVGATVPITWEGTLEDAWFVVNTGTTTATLFVDDCSLEAVVAQPVADPEPGSYDQAITVNLTCATAGATIRYTLDGTTPSAANGTDYTGPVGLAASTTLKAIALRNGMVDSDVFVAEYNVRTGTVITIR